MKPNPIPFALPDQEKRELQQMIDLGIIEETDIPCSAPVIFIKNTTIWDFVIREFSKITVLDPRNA